MNSSKRNKGFGIGVLKYEFGLNFYGLMGYRMPSMKIGIFLAIC